MAVFQSESVNRKSINCLGLVHELKRLEGIVGLDQVGLDQTRSDQIRACNVEKPLSFSDLILLTIQRNKFLLSDI